MKTENLEKFNARWSEFTTMIGAWTAEKNRLLAENENLAQELKNAIFAGKGDLANEIERKTVANKDMIASLDTRLQAVGGGLQEFANMVAERPDHELQMLGDAVVEDLRAEMQEVRAEMAAIIAEIQKARDNYFELLNRLLLSRNRVEPAIRTLNHLGVIFAPGKAKGLTTQLWDAVRNVAGVWIKSENFEIEYENIRKATGTTW